MEKSAEHKHRTDNANRDVPCNYLLDNHIKFYGDCVTGYAEAFVFNALLFEPKIAYSDIKLERDKMEIPQKEDFSQNNGCFSRIDAMLKVYETMQLTKKGSPALRNAFEYNKLHSNPLHLMILKGAIIMAENKTVDISKIMDRISYLETEDFKGKPEFSKVHVLDKLERCAEEKNAQYRSIANHRFNKVSRYQGVPIHLGGRRDS